MTYAPKNTALIASPCTITPGQPLGIRPRTSASITIQLHGRRRQRPSHAVEQFRVGASAGDARRR